MLLLLFVMNYGMTFNMAINSNIFFHENEKKNISLAAYITNRLELPQLTLLDENPMSRESSFGASLVVQWLRICLPTQGTWVRALVWEDPTYRGGTKPMRHHY